MLSLPPTHLNRAFKVFQWHNFTLYTGDNYYPDLALSVTEDPNIQQHLYNFEGTDRLDEFIRLNLTNWTMPEGDRAEWWAEKHAMCNWDYYNCLTADKIRTASDPDSEFLRAWENNWYYTSLNTHYAERVYWASNYWEDKESAQELYNLIQS